MIYSTVQILIFEEIQIRSIYIYIYIYEHKFYICTLIGASFWKKCILCYTMSGFGRKHSNVVRFTSIWIIEFIYNSEICTKSYFTRVEKWFWLKLQFLVCPSTTHDDDVCALTLIHIWSHFYDMDVNNPTWNDGLPSQRNTIFLFLGCFSWINNQRFDTTWQKVFSNNTHISCSCFNHLDSKIIEI